MEFSSIIQFLLVLVLVVLVSGRRGEMHHGLTRL